MKSMDSNPTMYLFMEQTNVPPPKKKCFKNAKSTLQIACQLQKLFRFIHPNLGRGLSCPSTEKYLRKCASCQSLKCPQLSNTKATFCSICTTIHTGHICQPGLLRKFFWRVQTWVSWQSPVTRWYSRELAESGIRAAQCYDCPTAQCGGGHDTEVGQAESETIKCSGNCHAHGIPRCYGST